MILKSLMQTSLE